MSVIVTNMDFPKDCGECEWFFFEGISCTTPRYYLDARCKRIPSGQDWYGEDHRGGWIGESIAHLPGYGGMYPHYHCIEMGTRPKNCPLKELKHHGRLIDADELRNEIAEAIKADEAVKDKWPAARQELAALKYFYEVVGDSPTVIPADKENADD